MTEMKMSFKMCLVIASVVSMADASSSSSTKKDASDASSTKDEKFWSTVDLRKHDVPKGVSDIGNDYVIDETELVVENSTEVEGIKLFFRDAKSRGKDSGQVSIR